MTSGFEARHVRRSGTIELDGPPDAAFALFTPAGEKEWVPEWDPVFLQPASGEARPGMVFTTGHGGEETLWSAVDYAPERRYVRYARVTPGSRFGFVEVACEAAAGGRSRATISYTLTALTEKGNAQIDAVDDTNYAAMLETWKAKVNACLAKRRA